MKKLPSLLTVATLLGLHSASISIESVEIDQWDANQPFFNLYSEGKIPECPQCDTIIINSSNSSIDTDLAKSFKLIALKSGKNHLGASIKRTQIIDYAAKLRSLKCELPTSSQENVAYFIFTKEKKCVKLPYSNQKILREALEIMYAHIESGELAKNEIEFFALKNNASSISTQAHEFIKIHYSIIKDIISTVSKKSLINK